MFLIPQCMCSFRRKRNIPANQLRDNNEEENDDEYEFGHLADQRENQQRDNNGEENNGGNEFDPREEQRDNNRDGNDGGYEVIPLAGQRGNQQRDNNREGNDGGYEAVHLAGQRENQQRNNYREGNDGGYEAMHLARQRENQQRGNNRDGNDGGYQALHLAGQRGNQQRGNNRKGNDDGNGEGNNGSCRIVNDKDFNNRQISFVGANRDIVDNQRENLSGQRSAAGYEDMSFPQGLPMLQDTSSGAMDSRNIPGNQHKENSNQQDCDVKYENEVAHQNDNQQLEEAYEDMSASQALATARQPVENDDVSGTN